MAGVSVGHARKRNQALTAQRLQPKVDEIVDFLNNDTLKICKKNYLNGKGLIVLKSAEFSSYRAISKSAT